MEQYRLVPLLLWNTSVRCVSSGVDLSQLPLCDKDAPDQGLMFLLLSRRSPGPAFFGLPLVNLPQQMIRG